MNAHFPDSIFAARHHLSEVSILEHLCGAFARYLDFKADRPGGDLLTTNFISGEITVSCWYALKVFLFLSTGAPSIIFSEPQLTSLRTAYPLPTLHPLTSLDSRRKHPRILHLPPALRRRRHHSKILPDAMWLRPTLNHRLIAVLESIEKGLSRTLPLADPTGTSVANMCNAWLYFRSNQLHP